MEFIRRLISPARGYAKDRPRDKEGKIIVDPANPHILENMDYFRPSALAYKKNGGMYTLLRPNANPNSEYGKWIREEEKMLGRLCKTFRWRMGSRTFILLYELLPYYSVKN